MTANSHDLRLGDVVAVVVGVDQRAGADARRQRTEKDEEGTFAHTVVRRTSEKGSPYTRVGWVLQVPGLLFAILSN